VAWHLIKRLGMAMRIPRLHLFELEDQSWFPVIVRDFATDYLHFIETAGRMHQPVVPLLAEALRKTGATKIVDLCSGGAGPVVLLRDALIAEGLHVQFTLTDRFPNLPAFQRAEKKADGGITFAAESVDARCVPKHLRGFRTMFNSFHHFAPADAKRVLANAVEAGEPIGIFEFPDRSVPVILSMIFVPLFVALGTPFIRPFRWARIFWTYVVPLVPLTCGWDGIVSQLRAYTVDELNALVRETGSGSYEWRVGRVALSPTPSHLTYLIGCPR